MTVTTERAPTGCGHIETGPGRPGTNPIGAVIERLQRVLDGAPAEQPHRRFFTGTYLRTTRAVADAVHDAFFEDPDWVERWDVAFAELYLAAARDEATAATPWRLAFDAPPGLPSLRHVLLGINAHINYDLPQALLQVIDDDDFGDPMVLARRRRDHERIDMILAARVKDEDGELGAHGIVDRLLTPLNRLGTKRFLREARRKVWHNTEQLQLARTGGPRHYRRRPRSPTC